MKTIIMILALASSFMPGKKSANPYNASKSLYIEYYWFDLQGNYLRQNTTGVETSITGYTANTDNPKTLREKGFNPSRCTGWPPMPDDFQDPDVSFYSHP